MGFLSFRKKSKAKKALNPPPPALVLDADINAAEEAPGSDYHSPIADSFMMVASSISDIAQSSLSEDIFKELVPLSIKSETSTKSKDAIRHSLSLKSSSNSVSISPLKINTAIHSSHHMGNDSIQSPLNESIISNTTRSSKQSDSSDSSFTSLSSTEEFVPLHPISRSDPHNYASKKVPLMDLVSRSSLHEQAVSPTTAAIPGLAMARMKERHRQEYRRSMQWSSPAVMMEYPVSKKVNSFTGHRTHPMHQLPPPSSSTPLVNPQAQIPLIHQIKPIMPMRSTSSSTYTSNPLERRPLIASIPQVNYQQPKPVVPVPDHRSYHLKNNSGAPQPYQQAEKLNTSQTRCTRQRLVGIAEHQYQQQQSFPHDVEPTSTSSKLKTDYRRIVYTRKKDYVPDLVDLLDREDDQQQQQLHHVNEKSSTYCSHHQPHHTLTKRQYVATDNSHCFQAHHPMNRCNHHHHHHHHNHHHQQRHRQYPNCHSKKASYVLCPS
ncbi:hypothetical protein G6F42_016710 [Rhizopus arrhizus]|nr:hypothetical protein G6F42_016710 [Rhizopus arrhizus]